MPSMPVARCAVISGHARSANVQHSWGGGAEDSRPGAEPGPPLIRFTQQDPGIGSDFGVLIICAGSGVTARIGTIIPEYGALGFRPGSVAAGRYVGPLALTGQR